jgi:hypothetical protein
LVEQELQVGGESVSKMHFDLLCNSQRQKDISEYTKQAETILFLKRKILQKMDELDGRGGWLQAGGRFILNKRKNKYKEKRLIEILNCLEKHGRLSPFFISFVEKRDRELY